MEYACLFYVPEDASLGLESPDSLRGAESGWTVPTRTGDAERRAARAVAPGSNVVQARGVRVRISRRIGACVAGERED